jgi:hypothetical protein
MNESPAFILNILAPASMNGISGWYKVYPGGLAEKSEKYKLLADIYSIKTIKGNVCPLLNEPNSGEARMFAYDTSNKSDSCILVLRRDKGRLICLEEEI